MYTEDNRKYNLKQSTDISDFYNIRKICNSNIISLKYFRNYNCNKHMSDKTLHLQYNIILYITYLYVSYSPSHNSLLRDIYYNWYNFISGTHDLTCMICSWCINFQISVSGNYSLRSMSFYISDFTLTNTFLSARISLGISCLNNIINIVYELNYLI